MGIALMAVMAAAAIAVTGGTRTAGLREPATNTPRTLSGGAAARAPPLDAGLMMGELIRALDAAVCMALQLMLLANIYC